MPKLFTIGFTKKTAEAFFTTLERAGVKRLVDVRLNNVSQLAGFAKRDDLRWLAKRICGIDYVHRLELAPTRELFDAYRKARGSWPDYERKFRALIAERRIEQIPPQELDGGCLLCSEDQPHRCHRRLVAEYLNEKWRGVEIEHL